LVQPIWFDQCKYDEGRHVSSLTFIGLGAIGLPMAQVLAKSGHDVIGVDPVDAARVRAADAGVSSVASVSGAPRTPVVIVMVATPEQLDVLVSDAGADLAGRTFIIMSTVGPAAVTAAAERLTAAGARVLDAPVTGGVARATTGELVIFAAGPQDVLDDVAGVLGALGTVRTVGRRVGEGQSIKVVNQHLCSVHIVAAAEALHLAETLGLDKSVVLDLVSGGAAGSWMLSDRGPRMLLGTDAPVRSTINIFVKDSGLVSDAATAAGADVPLLDVARQRYLDAVGRGLGLRDDSRVIETYQAKGDAR
jgi:3-hydroxyisobutyrate dehydrogenase